MSEETDKLLKKLILNVDLTNEKIEDLTDALNKFVAIKQPAPREPVTENPSNIDIKIFPELAGLPDEV